MKQLKTYKYKLYNPDTTKHLDRILDVSSWIYNHCIALHRRYYRLHKKQLNKYQLPKYLTKLKKQHIEWNEVPSQVIQDITDRIHDRDHNASMNILREGTSSLSACT